MESNQVARKLTAILSADVKGYSRLMEDDEWATIQTLTEYRAIMDRIITARHGRVVDSPGDNLLAEFPSVLDAVEGAVEIQRALAEQNEQLPPDRQMLMRIGVTCGDVVVDGDRIYGDGVNLAARLEGRAQPGGVLISELAYDQVKNKLDLRFCALGRQTFKNLDQPVAVYQVEVDPEITDGCDWSSRLRHGRGWWLAGLGLLAAGALAVGIMLGPWRQPPVGPPPPPMATPGQELKLPDKPSIAVLPFVNQSSDPGQSYFADGMTEDIITDLSRISGLFVISRNSSFTYKGRVVPPRQVGGELGVKYLVTGSVRRSADRIRVSAQLIDTLTGRELWAESYDRDLADIFALQDDLTRKIVAALEIKLSETEKNRLARRGTHNIQAYEYVKRANELANRYTRRDNNRAKDLYRQATAIDPAYAGAWAGLAWACFQAWPLGWADEALSLEPALEYAGRALSIDPDLPQANTVVGWVRLWEHRPDEAVSYGQRALELDPNNFEAMSLLANAFCFAGRPNQAIDLARRAIRLNPRVSETSQYSLAHAYFLTGRLTEAADVLQQVIARAPGVLPARVLLTAVLVELGRPELAKEQLAELKRLAPTYDLKLARTKLPYKDRQPLDRVLSDLAQAGLTGDDSTRPNIQNSSQRRDGP